MPDRILSILKDLYHADEYTLLDGDKTASVQPSFSVKKKGLLIVTPNFFGDPLAVCR